MLGFATSNLMIQRKVKKHGWLNLSRLIETAMFSRNIKGLFPYYQFKMDVNSSPSNPREEAWIYYYAEQGEKKKKTNKDK